MSATLGLDAARAVDPARFRLGTTVPRAALRPANRDEVAEALRAATRDELAVIPWGGGVALERERAPARYDLALDLGALDRIVEYEPEDLTLTAECGVTIATLRATLAARGQELPLEAAHAARATLGGTLAANASGARRLRFGAPHDRILGARFALGDGTLARTGGKVVKNVAGYGIHRLLCGARGGLAVMLEASLKLMPAPERRVALIYDVEPRRLADAPLWTPFARMEPSALTVIGRACAGRLPVPAPGAGLALIVGIEDDAPWTARQIERVSAMLGTPVARAGADEAVALWQAIADLEEFAPERLSFASSHHTPHGLSDALPDALLERSVFHAPAGRLHLFPGDGDVAATIAALAERGFTLTDARLERAIEPTQPPQQAVRELRARIRAALDPGSRFALGERWERGAGG
jgi:glycolate oxidase FAD binding subunit